MEESLKGFVVENEKELEDGRLLFFATKQNDGLFEAQYRVSYKFWVDNDCDEKYYYDVAENDERVMFSHIVNGLPLYQGGKRIY